eukprot:5197463-Pleurochrysis_carterae.AAC.2
MDTVYGCAEVTVLCRGIAKLAEVVASNTLLLQIISMYLSLVDRSTWLDRRFHGPYLSVSTLIYNFMQSRRTTCVLAASTPLNRRVGVNL